MKKVICINSKNYLNPFFEGPRPEEGDIVNVLFEETTFGILYYQLAGFPQESRFAAWRFAPLDSDLDETELVTEEFEEKYCVPVKNSICE